MNTLSMRIKEWYSWHFPELAKIVTDNQVYVRLVDYIGDKKALSEDHLAEIEELVTDADLARQVLEAAKQSMG